MILFNYFMSIITDLIEYKSLNTNEYWLERSNVLMKLKSVYLKSNRVFR